MNRREYDPLKLKVAAYYYNQAKKWGKEVTIDTKDSAYPAGSVLDFLITCDDPALLASCALRASGQQVVRATQCVYLIGKYSRF